jgi:hypothetical protein
MTPKVATKSSTDSGLITAMPPTARSRISNGSAILDGIDGRSREARRFRDVLGEIVSDLGGHDMLSEGQRQLARRCAMLAVECEKIEALGVAGQTIDLEQYGQLTDRIGRCFQRLGLERRAKDVGTPSLSDLVRLEDEERRQEEAAARAAEAAAGNGQADSATRTGDDGGA